jgi:hypothetical protein
MENQNNIVVQPEIENRIYTIRNKQVMLDSHLAELYNVETKQLNRAVKRNLERFPVTYHFQLTEQEFESLRCQFGTSSIEHGGRRYLPYKFTNDQKELYHIGTSFKDLGKKCFAFSLIEDKSIIVGLMNKI